MVFHGSSMDSHGKTGICVNRKRPPGMEFREYLAIHAMCHRLLETEPEARRLWRDEFIKVNAADTAAGSRFSHHRTGGFPMGLMALGPLGFPMAFLGPGGVDQWVFHLGFPHVFFQCVSCGLKLMMLMMVIYADGGASTAMKSYESHSP